jgi:hypothetical protein
MVTKDISELEKDIMQKITELAFKTHAHIVENTPVAKSVPSDKWSEGHTGGRLRSSIVIEKTSDGFIIGTTVPYAEEVELGVMPHIIVPVTKKALKWGRGKNSVFATRVNHPGFDGRAMFLKGSIFLESELDKLR